MVTAKLDKALLEGDKKLAKAQKKNDLLIEQGEKTLTRSRNSCRAHWGPVPPLLQSVY